MHDSCRTDKISGQIIFDKCARGPVKSMEKQPSMLKNKSGISYTMYLMLGAKIDEPVTSMLFVIR